MPSKTEDSQSVAVLVLSAWLMASLGVILGIAFMLSFTPRALASETEIGDFLGKIEEAGTAPGPEDIYYLDGASARSSQWPAKKSQLEAPGPQTVRISAGDINSWLRSNFQFANEPEAGAGGTITLIPGMPSVAMGRSDVLYLSMPVEVLAFGARKKWTLFLKSDVATGDFRIEELRMQSAKIPLANLLGKRVLGTFLNGLRSQEAFGFVTDALERAESIKVENAELVLDLL